MKALVAGFGNVFFGDDGFGCEVARLMLSRPSLPGVVVKDFGIRGMHAAFEMLDGYEIVIFVDAVSRGGEPGTLYVIDPIRGGLPQAEPDPHSMHLESVFSLYRQLSRDLSHESVPKIFVVGCEPQTTEEGMGLSSHVAAAVPATPPLIEKVLTQNGIGAQANEATEKQAR